MQYSIRLLFSLSMLALLDTQASWPSHTAAAEVAVPVCPREKYFNKLSRMCDPCPEECRTNPPPAGTSNFMTDLCLELAGQCSPAPQTPISGATSATSSAATGANTNKSGAASWAYETSTIVDRSPAVHPAVIVGSILAIVVAVTAAIAIGIRCIKRSPEKTPNDEEMQASSQPLSSSAESSQAGDEVAAVKDGSYPDDRLQIPSVRATSRNVTSDPTVPPSEAAAFGCDSARGIA